MLPISRNLQQAQAKQAIASHFGQAAAAYHGEAQMQRDCAKQLLSYLSQPLILPPGKILEVGCGTGFITQELVQSFPDRSLEITDLSAEMLQFCRTHLQTLQHNLIEFRQLDGEAIASASPYAMIVSGFTIQWFADPIATLQNWRSQIQEGGILLISFPTCQSFPEWRQICTELNLPFTANPLPDAETVWTALAQGFSQYQTYEENIRLTFNSASDFFRNLKAIGTGFNSTGKQLSLSQMRRLIEYWDSQTKQIAQPITIHFHVAFGVLQR
ncbi:MAG: methyltransferase domain-containing protein [Drouetiella hepatica Uher 2000/2452]|jgi:malonyl-CoA O-methyltransferase|uniref:Methyltransferase domain-containing protein n=1 Tax=Drouetiella hepatica Uher 2000/2452 TaxID=904376 RepID=A0A951QBA4_9CYAN|nr:methyltransferase domain-containing protein [Drouetiella hepatica Uher 2000/2452]